MKKNGILVVGGIVALSPAAVFGGSFPTSLQNGMASIVEQQSEAEAGWGWDGGDHKVHKNLGGVVANALLDAYAHQPDAAVWVTLVQYADQLENYYVDADGVPFRADIEFLARAQQRGLVQESALARSLFSRLRHVSPTGEDEYTRVAEGRAPTPELVGYDVALGLRAAMAVGEYDYAQSLASIAVDAGGLRLTSGSDAYAVLSTAALAYAVSQLPGSRFNVALRRAANSLVETQTPPGSWANNNSQASAYAVLFLGQLKDFSDAQQAASVGRAWLLRSQLRSGAWGAFNDGWGDAYAGPVLPLVQAEILQALVRTMPP